MKWVNPFLANAPSLYPLKTPENQRFSVVFRGYKIGTFAWNGLIQQTLDFMLLSLLLMLFTFYKLICNFYWLRRWNSLLMHIKENIIFWETSLNRSSQTITKVVARSYSVKTVFLKISKNSQENTFVRISFLIKLTFLKRRLWHRCFPVNFVKFLRTSFLKEHLPWLFLPLNTWSWEGKLCRDMHLEI